MVNELANVGDVDAAFRDPALAIYAGDTEGLTRLLELDPGLATRRSTVGHPTLLQLVACEALDLPDPVASAAALLDAGADASDPLVAAAGCGSRDVVELMLERGTPVDGIASWTPLDEAIYWCQIEIARDLAGRGASMARLRRAGGLGDMDTIEGFFETDGRLIAAAGPIASPWDQEGDVDRGDESRNILDHAFVMAVNALQVDAATTLLARGARINAKPPGFHWNGTALHAACWRGDRDLIQWLLDEGADPSITDDMDGVGVDAIAWARHHGNDDLIPLLEAAAR